MLYVCMYVVRTTVNAIDGVIYDQRLYPYFIWCMVHTVWYTLLLRLSFARRACALRLPFSATPSVLM